MSIRIAALLLAFRVRVRALLVMTFVLASPLGARASPQLLVGVGGGVSSPGVPRAAYGPLVTVGVEGTLGFPLSLRVDLETSRHQLLDGSLQRTELSAGLSYRLDVATVVPYASGLVRYGRLSGSGADPREPETSLGGVLALGALLPVGRWFYLGLEARYGAGLPPAAFPTTSAYLLRAGLRLGEFL